MTDIRFALDDDLALLAGIEDAADGLFVERFVPEEWGSAPDGRWRASQPGFVLIGRDADQVVGFAHVLEVGGGAHLEQVAVLPGSGRRGHGRALVDAAAQEAGDRGHHRLTLRTYADVPWNAAFYATAGFVESEPDTDFLRSLVEIEHAAGIDRYGRRVQMTRRGLSPARDRVVRDHL